jgi:hypothetical protein
VTPAELHAAVLAALAEAEAAEQSATPAPWFAAARYGKTPVVGVPATDRTPARAIAVFGHTGVERGPDARLVAALRNTAAAVYADVRDIVERHAPEPTLSRLRCGYCASLCHSSSGLGCETGGDAPWLCPDYRAAARMIPNLPEEVADALGHR